jgi:hypothetical protein
MKITDQKTIHPEQTGNIRYWSNKWGVSQRELTEAIIQTGSLDTGKVKEFLKRDSWVYHPVEGTKKIVRSTLQFIF